MLTIPLLRWAIDHLRRPFIQRLISLVVSTLLAMSLIYTTSVLPLPPLEHKVALYVSNQSAQSTSIVHFELGLMPNRDAYGQHYKEGRLV
jgi:hypothetical protein